MQVHGLIKCLELKMWKIRNFRRRRGIAWQKKKHIKVCHM